jgi:predicted nuclease of predicted toxin-antitoxin system
MTDRIRFHLDENADPRIARALRRMDIDAISIVEAGIRTLSDAAQCDYAKSQQRVIVTSDDDFLVRAEKDSTIRVWSTS